MTVGCFCHAEFCCAVVELGYRHTGISVQLAVPLPHSLPVWAACIGHCDYVAGIQCAHHVPSKGLLKSWPAPGFTRCCTQCCLLPLLCNAIVWRSCTNVVGLCCNLAHAVCVTSTGTMPWWPCRLLAAIICQILNRTRTRSCGCIAIRLFMLPHAASLRSILLCTSPTPRSFRLKVDHLFPESHWQRM